MCGIEVHFTKKHILVYRKKCEYPLRPCLSGGTEFSKQCL